MSTIIIISSIKAKITIMSGGKSDSVWRGKIGLTLVYIVSYYESNRLIEPAFT